MMPETPRQNCAHTGALSLISLTPPSAELYLSLVTRTALAELTQRLPVHVHVIHRTERIAHLNDALHDAFESAHGTHMRLPSVIA